MAAAAAEVMVEAIKKEVTVGAIIAAAVITAGKAMAGEIALAI